MRKIVLFFLISFGVFVSGCSSYYGVLKEGKLTGDLKQYKVINVGWLNLNEEKWKEFGYENKEKWVTTINFMNQKYMPDYFKQILLGKKVTVVASKKDEPDKEGLVIKFSEVEYVPRTSTAAKVMFGSMAGSDTLDVTIHFIDGKTAEELYLVRASLYSTGKIDYSGWAFEGRVINCVYNLVVFVNEKLK
jgi:hypothetical protein